MSKKEGLKKIRLYDWLFWISLTSIILFYASFAFESLWIASIVLIVAFMISWTIFGWGMIYWACKREEYGWAVGNFFVPFLVIYFYFGKVRKDFKKGKLKHKDKLSEKEKQEIEHYQKHKEDIDKKDNEDFIKFLKIIGIVIGVIILGLILRSVL